MSIKKIIVVDNEERKAEKCAAYVGKRESLSANYNDLIGASLKIIRAPSSGRGSNDF